FVKATGYRMGNGSNGKGGWGYDSSGVFGQSLDYVWEEPGFRSGFRPTDAHPATQIDWYGANAFCDWLNKELSSQLPSDLKFRLPTEAEWERACRAGTTTPYFWGSSLNGDKANCNGDKPYGTSAKGEFFERTTEVGSYAANPWGLRDMHGDVWEWCADWYGEYVATSLTDPTGARSGTRRVLRGGCWSGEAKSCRSAARSCADPASRYCYCGFRLVLGREL
ncbi:MAG: SUMF1/EgtB/PvdO family nonheme iron enzyme, partial [Thermoguttaceae bacterium]|nr:SUMF1/EgtB/PvdO family nonheme iron enzyme [Thermoguttaceae bacterium]